MQSFDHGMVSCIIPVYNEGPRVLGVLKAVIGHPLIDEVIVVNDGSTDDSEAILKSVDDIRLISYKQNRGKSYAVMLGFKAMRNDLVLMVDADLVGLTAEDVSALIKPVADGLADMTISLRKNSLFIYKLFGLDYVSGERVFRKDIINNFDKLGLLPGFGLETFLNRILIDKKLRLRVVQWKNVALTLKQKKLGFWAGTKGDFKMIKEILILTGFVSIFRMFVGMLRLKV